MKRKWLLGILFCCLPALSQNTVLTGTMVDPAGHPFTGYLKLRLSQQGSAIAPLCASSGAPAQVLPNIVVAVQFTNGAMVSPPKVWGADCLNPSGIPYNVDVQDTFGNSLLKDQWLITGNSFDVGYAVSIINGNINYVPGLAGPIGPPGPPNVLVAGTTTTLAPGAAATTTITGTSPSQTLKLGIPSGLTGPPGLLPKGVWSNTTAYNTGDFVGYNTANYACITGCAIGVLPTTIANWQQIYASGGILTVTTVAVNTTVTNVASQQLYRCTATLTLTMPAVPASGQWVAVKNYGTGTITVNPGAGATIDGAANKVIPASGVSGVYPSNTFIWDAATSTWNLI